MKKISRLLMGVAAMTMLASCAKTITSAEAAKIIASWNYSQAIGNYNKCVANAKGSDGSSSSKTYDLTKTEEKAAILGEITLVNTALTLLATRENSLVTWKAKGNALQVEGTDGDGNKFIYHTQEDGLPTYSKAISGETWSDVSYTWSK